MVHDVIHITILVIRDTNLVFDSIRGYSSRRVYFNRNYEISPMKECELRFAFFSYSIIERFMFRVLEVINMGLTWYEKFLLRRRAKKAVKELTGLGISKLKSTRKNTLKKI